VQVYKRTFRVPGKILSTNAKGLELARHGGDPEARVVSTKLDLQNIRS
jgi:hypothetical protein